MFFNKKRNSLTEKIYSGTPLLRSPMGQKKFCRINGVAVFTRVFFFLQENVWRFLPGGKVQWP